MKEKKVLMAQLLHTPVIAAVYCLLLVIKLHLDAFIHLYTFLILRKLQPINPFIFFSDHCFKCMILHFPAQPTGVLKHTPTRMNNEGKQHNFAGILDC